MNYLFDDYDAASGQMTTLVDLPPRPEPIDSPNPMVVKFGPGPAGITCCDCVHLHGFRQSATWYKCELRAWKSKGGKYPGTIYPGKDHRVRWPACAKFEERKDEAAS